MNKIFKVKKNALGQSVACSELATSRSKALLVSAVLAVASVGVSANINAEWLDEEQMNTPEGSITSEWKKGQDISWTLEDFMSKNRGFIYDLRDYLGNTNANVEANREEIANRAEGLQAQITANQADSAKNFADTNAKIQANKEALETKVEKRDFYHVQDNVNNNNTEIAKLQANKADVEYVDNVAEGVLANKVASARNKADIATNKADIVTNKDDIKKNKTATETNRTAIDGNTAKIKSNTDALANKVDVTKFTTLEGKVTTLETQVSDITPTKARVSALETRVNKLDKNLSAGIAGTAALSMMPAAGEKGAHYITAGAGHYNGQQAIAIGLAGNSESGKFNYKVGASATTSGSPVVGAGVGFRWK